MSAALTNMLEFQFDEDNLEPDQNDPPTDRRNLIAYYIFGVCNLYGTIIIMEFGVFGEYHQLLFYSAIPFTVIKLLPLFTYTWLKYIHFCLLVNNLFKYIFCMCILVLK